MFEIKCPFCEGNSVSDIIDSIEDVDGQWECSNGHQFVIKYIRTMEKIPNNDDFQTTILYPCDVINCKKHGNNSYYGVNYCEEHYLEVKKEITVNLNKLKRLVEIAFDGNEFKGSEFSYFSDEYSNDSKIIEEFQELIKKGSVWIEGDRKRI